MIVAALFWEKIPFDLRRRGDVGAVAIFRWVGRLAVFEGLFAGKGSAGFRGTP